MTPSKIIEVVSAFEAGKKIEKREKGCPHRDWVKSIPSWNFEQFEYRVAPELREFWIVMATGDAYWNKEAAETVARHHTHQEVVHVREVLSDNNQP